MLEAGNVVALPFRERLLDLLVDGPSSFAALYGAANRFLVTPGTRVRHGLDEIWDALVQLEAGGFVRSRLALPDGRWGALTDLTRHAKRRSYREWLPRAAYEDLSVDEIGVWFEILPAGRELWASHAAPCEGPKWMLDMDSVASSITVCAPDEETAEKVLSEWLVQHPGIELTGSRVFNPVTGYQLRDGIVVEGGVSVRVGYRSRAAECANPALDPDPKPR